MRLSIYNNKKKNLSWTDMEDRIARSKWHSQCHNIHLATKIVQQTILKAWATWKPPKFFWSQFVDTGETFERRKFFINIISMRVICCFCHALLPRVHFTHNEYLWKNGYSFARRCSNGLSGCRIVNFTKLQ